MNVLKTRLSLKGKKKKKEWCKLGKKRKYKIRINKSRDDNTRAKANTRTFWEKLDGETKEMKLGKNINTRDVKVM